MEEKRICPQCSHTRKKSNVKCMSYNTETGLFRCHHCSYSGKEGGYNNLDNYVPPKIKPDVTIGKPTDRMEEFFESRGISKEVTDRNGIGMTSDMLEIMFPFYRDGEIINVKYRSFKKKFRQEANAEKILYGLDDIKGCTSIIIVEGEIDKLSLEEVGYNNVISVPDGAPAPNTKAYESKFSYLDNCADAFEDVTKIILAVDNDAPGKVLQEELTRRLGPERCWVVHYPEGSKDPNDVLMDEFESLKDLIEHSTAIPIEGISTVNDVYPEIIALYEEGQPGGHTTGWPKMDPFYTVREGEFTVVTGIPSHGKSEFIDAMLIQLSVLHEWKHALFSPENYPLQGHVAKLVKKYLRKQFGKGYTTRMTIDELEGALPWLNDHFYFISHSADNLRLDDILEKAKISIFRYGIRSISIDPWNEIDHSRPQGKSETEYVSECLTKIRRFARLYKVHIWLIAHPTKMYRDASGNYPVPTPYDISGSAHFRNKADNCITVWRDIADESKKVEIHIQKVRFREVGKVGMCEFQYNVATGRYV